MNRRQTHEKYILESQNKTNLETILFYTPTKNYFVATFVLNIAAVKKAKLVNCHKKQNETVKSHSTA